MCERCTICGPNQFEQEPCISTTDTICKECDDLYCEEQSEQLAGGSRRIDSGSDAANVMIATKFREGCGSGASHVIM